MEADDLDLILEAIDEPGGLRDGLGAYLQDCMHGTAADGFIGIPEGCLLQSGSEHGQNAMSALAKVSQGRDRLYADIPVGILQKGDETFRRFQPRGSRMPGRSVRDAFEGTVMAEAF
jgi:hypothetical protein